MTCVMEMDRVMTVDAAESESQEVVQQRTHGDVEI